jgi:hypothetical protein
MFRALYIALLFRAGYKEIKLKIRGALAQQMFWAKATN